MLNCSYQLKLGGPNTCQISMKNDGLPCSRLQRLFMREFSKFQTDVIVTPLRDCDFFSRSTWLDMWLSYKYFHFFFTTACHFVGLDYIFLCMEKTFSIWKQIQVNLFQKHLFLYQLTHNMQKIVHWITSSVHDNSKLRTCWEHVVYTNCFFLFLFWHSEHSSSEKDLPVSSSM